MTTEITDASTLAEARVDLRERASDGADCPLCHQHVKVYRRNINASMARVLIAMYVHHGRGPCHVPTLMKHFLPDIAHQGGNATMTQHWSLIEPYGDARRADGGRTGGWALTERGERFVTRGLRVPKYAYIYNGKRLRYSGLDEPMVSISDALGTDFDLAELLSGVPALGVPR